MTLAWGLQWGRAQGSRQGASIESLCSELGVAMWGGTRVYKVHTEHGVQARSHRVITVLGCGA
jgi:hypothetical protein